MSDEFDARLAAATSAPHNDFVGPQPPSRIAAAERRLAVDFPPTYRRFLEVLGAGNLGSEEIYGVLTDDFDDSGVPDAVWRTLLSRQDLDLPPSMVIIYYDGFEAFHALDTAITDSRGEAPVVVWVPGADEVETLASDFAEWFLRLEA